MDKKSHRLCRQDWILAGFRNLVAGGPSALRVERVAKELSATKGSFYWHFEGPADWRDAMLAYWRQSALEDVVAALAGEPDGRSRLRALIRLASTMGRDPAHGGVLAEPALRAWAREDPIVAQSLREVDAARLDFLAACLAEAGLAQEKAHPGARLIYAAHIGQQALGASADQDIDDLNRLLDDLLAR